MNARDKSIFYACIQHLQNIPFHVMDIFDDVDDKLFAFESLYLDIINEFAPVKNFHVRGKRKSSTLHDRRMAQIHPTTK